MGDDEKAKIILEALDEYMQINWNLEEHYIKGIKKGLTEINRREQDEETQDTDRDDFDRNSINSVS